MRFFAFLQGINQCFLWSKTKNDLQAKLLIEQHAQIMEGNIIRINFFKSSIDSDRCHGGGVILFIIFENRERETFDTFDPHVNDSSFDRGRVDLIG